MGCAGSKCARTGRLNPLLHREPGKVAAARASAPAALLRRPVVMEMPRGRPQIGYRVIWWVEPEGDEGLFTP